VHRASFVQDFFKLSLIAPWLLATWIALNSCDFLVCLALSRILQIVPLSLIEVVVAVALLVVVALGKRSFSSSSWSARRAIMLCSSMVVVGRLRPKSWYVCFEKRLFRK
jgi:hypothetical protein